MRPFFSSRSASMSSSNAPKRRRLGRRQGVQRCRQVLRSLPFSAARVPRLKPQLVHRSAACILRSRDQLPQSRRPWPFVATRRISPSRVRVSGGREMNRQDVTESLVDDAGGVRARDGLQAAAHSRVPVLISGSPQMRPEAGAGDRRPAVEGRPAASGSSRLRRRPIATASRRASSAPSRNRPRAARLDSAAARSPRADPDGAIDAATAA